MAPSILTRTRPHRSAPQGQRLAGDLSLEHARVHEFCGNARQTLALILAGQMQGPVLWIAPPWQNEHLNPDGILPFTHPARFVFLAPGRADDLLWTMEEVLRSGAVALVIAELSEPPGLTPVRRLHLATETGRAEGRLSPLGILLTPGKGGAQGIESRWHITQDHAAQGGPGWRLDRLRARRAPPGSWRLEPSTPGSPPLLKTITPDREIL